MAHDVGSRFGEYSLLILSIGASEANQNIMTKEKALSMFYVSFPHTAIVGLGSYVRLWEMKSWLDV